MKYLLLPFAALILLFWNCSNQFFYLIDPDLKAYFDFLKGSYWIYYDEDHQLYDTVTVDSYLNAFRVDQMDENIDHYEYLDIMSKSTLDTLIVINDRLGEDWHGTSTAQREISVYDSILRYELDFTSNSLKNAGNLTRQVNGTEYKNCYHYSHQNETNSDMQDTSFLISYDLYISKNIGIIEKKYEYVGKTYHWKLISYHIADQN